VHVIGLIISTYTLCLLKLHNIKIT